MTTTVLRNGAVFTADAARSWASAVAWRDGRIIALGGDAEVAPYVSGADDVVDLVGRLVTPGFVDAHVHPIVGGLERIRCDLTAVETLAEYADLVAAYAAGTEAGWILGGGWSMAAFPGGRPTASQLDAIVADRPVYLPNRDHHSAWVNTRALELAGIDATTADPRDGRIERDAEGRPTGLLHEGAMGLVEQLLPADTAQDRLAGLRAAQSYLHSLGITGWQDAMVKDAEHATYLAARDAGWLTARVAGALWWERDGGAHADDIAKQLAHLVELRAQAEQPGRSGPEESGYTLPHVKVMQDGVMETFTAALLSPYCRHGDHPEHGGGTGLRFFEPDHLDAVVAAIDGAGFGVHAHALGDQAVRDVLDALERATALNGSADRRHHLAHLQLVDASDVGRFARIGAAANAQALWACHEPQMDELTIPFLGDRAEAQYPFGALHRAGVTLVMGSDWPVSTPDPWAAIHTAVHRISAEAPAGTPALGPDQSIPLGVALAAYTAGSAWVTRLGTGRLAPGLDADVVVHDRNPFSVEAAPIADTGVERTYVGGRLVHHLS